jgi:LysR family transcriptional regulator, low CO2-responsive transcriptional regulator
MSDEWKTPKGRTGKKIDISLLQTFHQVARTGSFSSASRELNISYQSAANHVRRLEQMYGSKLVEAEKGSRQVILTPQGKALHASLGKELETILSRISVLMHDVHTVFRIGVPQALFHHFFPEIVSQFRQHAKDTELAFYERDTVLEEMMMDGSLDVCINERHFGKPAITQHLINEYRLSLIYPRNWHDKVLGEGDIHFFIDMPFITYEAGQTIRSRAADYLTNRFQASPNTITSTSGSTGISRLAEAGLGYAIVPEWCVSNDNPNVAKIILNDIKTIKIYFGHTVFLEKNEHVLRLYEACKNTMSQLGSYSSDIE